ncbi:uncharacterized protein SAMN02910358_01422 [Lachnospiraceae bacterium XBB1006]|nr:uncharacterized protein SAMN02910358_01422 [Lachnospiraceae bacterium XBB1006]
MRSKEKWKNDKRAVNAILGTMQEDKHVQEMKKYIQHGTVSTYEHCVNVAKLSYHLNKKLHLKADEQVLVKGAMLHDFYLYDWHYEGDGSHHLHGFSHPKRASENAKELLHVEPEIQQVIESHMWPLTLKTIPKSREAWLVCMADKLVSTRETILNRRKKDVD